MKNTTKKFKTIGVITNYYFDYDMECYVYDLGILINDNFVKNTHYTHDDEDSDIFSKEILEKFNERTQDTKNTCECEPMTVTIKANYVHHPDHPEDDCIEPTHISRKHVPHINTCKIKFKISK